VIKKTRSTNGAVQGFAQRLKALRVQKNLSQQELAEKAGLSNILVSRYERGVSRPAADKLKQIADTLEVSTDYLLEGKEEGGTRVRFGDRKVLDLFQQIEQLPDSEKKFVIQVLDALLTNHKFKALASG